MTNYVLGFAFSEDRQRVVLIKKNGNSVPEHRGRLNGVGGKIEAHETTYEAMAREFREETGLDIPDFLWDFRGSFSGEGFSVKVFATATDEIYQARTMESEEVSEIYVPWLRSAASEEHVCSYVGRLVEFCLDERVKSFEFREA